MSGVHEEGQLVTGPMRNMGTPEPELLVTMAIPGWRCRFAVTAPPLPQ
jgi:hypothetical protein